METDCARQSACAAQAHACGGAAPKLELAEVLRAGLNCPAARELALSEHAHKVLGAILACGTPQLGGHWYRCEECGAEHFVPHSCRNRHCPRCQRSRAEEWLERESECLLPVPYFHLVFTLPHALNGLIRQNQAALYRLLFASASAALLEFGRRRFGGQIGVTAVLHTWGQTLCEHYHLHCIVSAGALSDDRQRFRTGSANYLFPVGALSEVFRAKFRDGLWELYRDSSLEFHGALGGQAEERGFAALMRDALRKPWSVYAKKPFAGPGQVLAYLSRYTHRVAIGSGRLCSLDLEAQTVTFRYKDYADHHRQKQMTLSTVEFLRRFCLHILPAHFVKIRHYGLTGNHQRKEKLAAARAALERESSAAGAEEAAPLDQASIPAKAGPQPPPRHCPRCGSIRLVLLRHELPGRRLRLDSS